MKSLESHNYLSNIWVAITTGLPRILQVSTILFWIGGTSQGFISTPARTVRYSEKVVYSAVIQWVNDNGFSGMWQQ